jgi:N-acetylmuramoyl-L-alanine amidase
MSYLIAIDDGHGSQTSGKRTPNIAGIGVIKENTFNSAVANLLNIELKRCGFRTLLVAPTDYDTPLGTRTALANRNKANAYVSIHYNAGGGEGVETYHYPGSTNGKKLATLVHKYVREGTKQKDRGVKSANFQVLRETRMPACLVEYGFMDDPSRTEAKRMIDPKFQLECAIETAKGICEYFGVKYIAADQELTNPAAPASMYDMSIAKNYDLVGLRSSTHPEELAKVLTEMMKANANFILAIKRDADIEVLQKTINNYLSKIKK